MTLLQRAPLHLLAFLVPLVLYLAAAAYLVYGLEIVLGDAWSRVGNAYYVLFSRDPHLAAIGFVWNPLPALATMPMVLLSPVWPDLVKLGFAANIVSATFMAGSVYVFHRLAREVGVGRVMAAALAATFALHPMILLYAANGMSEAPFLFFLLAATRELLAWNRTREVRSLVWAGGALGLAYLARYEAAMAAVLAVLAVLAISWMRSAASRRERWEAASADAVIVGFPFGVSFAGWALASWIIVGSPFATFTSAYGNASQVGRASSALAQATGQGTEAAAGYFITQVAVLAPLGIAFVLGATMIAGVRRNGASFIPLALFGGVLAFAGWAFLSGSSFGWLRFSITVIPMTWVLAAITLGQGFSLPATRWTHHIRGTLRGALAAVVVTSLVVAWPISAAAMLSSTIGREESGPLRVMAAELSGSSQRISEQAHLAVAGDVAAYLDRMALNDGEVLADAALSFGVILRSDDPKQFVITPDRDFEAVLADPVVFGIRYLLVPNPGGVGGLDAINRKYPGIYENGASFLTLVREFRDGESEYRNWRLYEVTPQAASAR